MWVSQMFEKKCPMRPWDTPTSVTLETMSLMLAGIKRFLFPSFAATVYCDAQSLPQPPHHHHIIYLNSFVYHFIDYPVEQKPRWISTIAMLQRLSSSACTRLLTWYKFISKMFYLLFCLQCGQSIPRLLSLFFSSPFRRKAASLHIYKNSLQKILYIILLNLL